MLEKYQGPVRNVPLYNQSDVCDMLIPHCSRLHRPLSELKMTLRAFYSEKEDSIGASEA